MLKKILATIAVLLAILVSIIPINYFLFYNRNASFLQLKSDALLADTLWNASFFTHITTGGIALLIGWLQFLPKIRRQYRSFHRFIGKIYVVTFLLCGLSSLIMSLNATGGLIPALGFGTMGVVSFYVTMDAFLAVKKRNFSRHETMMIYSYACCFAAVTFRLWQTSLSLTGLDYYTLYPIAAWTGWVPNLFVARWWIQRKEQQQAVYLANSPSV